MRKCVFGELQLSQNSLGLKHVMLFSHSKELAEEKPTRFEQAWNFKKSIVEGMAITQ